MSTEFAGRIDGKGRSWFETIHVAGFCGPRKLGVGGETLKKHFIYLAESEEARKRVP
jgi:hypothetical protein